MGTSALLTFADAEEGSLTVYEHYDGYPAGIARKLEAYQQSDSRGHAARYLRASEYAEIAAPDGMTPGGNYTYQITRSKGRVYIDAFSERQGPAIFRGTLGEFLDRYLPEKEIA